MRLGRLMVLSLCAFGVLLASCGTDAHRAGSTEVVVAQGSDATWRSDLHQRGGSVCFRVRRGTDVVADDCDLPDGPVLNLAIDLSGSDDLFYGYGRPTVRGVEVDLGDGVWHGVPVVSRGGRTYFCYSPPRGRRVRDLRAVDARAVVLENNSDKIAAAYAQLGASR